MSRQKGTIISSGNEAVDKLCVDCINKILLFDKTIDYTQFDWMFGTLQSRPNRLIKYLIKPESVGNVTRIASIIFNGNDDNVAS